MNVRDKVNKINKFINNLKKDNYGYNNPEDVKRIKELAFKTTRNMLKREKELEIDPKVKEYKELTEARSEIFNKLRNGIRLSK